MATNQCYELFNRFELLAPVGIAINSNDPIQFGRGSHTMVGIAQTSQSVVAAPYNDNTGYITVQVTGAVNVSVKGQATSSPSAGAAIKRGDPVYLDGGTRDETSGITYGGTLDADAAGTFFGIAMDPVLAGATTTIRVILRNSV